MSKFKAGDKVIYDGSADDYAYYRGKLVKGNAYTVLGYQGVHNCINLVEFPNAEIMDSRFKLAEQSQMNKIHPFKVGDYVKCIEKPSDSYRITIGKIYKVLALSNWGSEIKINADGGPKDWQYILASRFERVEKPLTEEASSASINSMNKKITYHVGFPQNGVVVQESKHEDLEDAIQFYKGMVKSHGKTLVYAISIRRDGVETIILQSEEPIKAPVVNGYEMKYGKGNQYVEFGCAKISLQMLWPIKDVMFDSFAGCNRNVDSISLNSGVIIGKEKMKEIFDYVEKVNGVPYSLPK